MGQLPPVNASRLFSDKAQASNAGQAGQLLYSSIKDCIFLTEVVRQRGDPCYTCSEKWQRHAPGAECTRLRDFLLKLRYSHSSVGQNYSELNEEDMEWLRERSSHRLDGEEKEKFETGYKIYIHPKIVTMMKRNKEELLKMSDSGIPIVKCLARDTGPCVKSKMKQGKGEYEFGQLPKRTYFCKGAPVMMTTNLCIEWGLFNGSMGIIADIYFANGHKPALDGKEHPDAILVHMPGYCGPEVIQGHPHLVPIGASMFQEHCSHECTRCQFPFRMCWAITCHKSQGMTVGPGKQVELAEVNLGPNDTESWAAGSALVELSRVTEIGALMVDGPVDLLRFTSRSKAKQAVANEDGRLFEMFKKTMESEPWLADEGEYVGMIEAYYNP